jgi:hypothetical protein
VEVVAEGTDSVDDDDNNDYDSDEDGIESARGLRGNTTRRPHRESEVDIEAGVGVGVERAGGVPHPETATTLYTSNGTATVADESENTGADHADDDDDEDFALLADEEKTPGSW